MKKNRLFASIIILHLALFVIAQQKVNSYLFDPNSSMREHVLDFERMRLRVEFEPEKGLVKGNITHFFSPLIQSVDSFFLDGPGILIKEAKLNGESIKYKIFEEGIAFFPSKTLHWNERDSLFISYEATPRRGLYFIGWNDPNQLSRKQIWTQGQGTDNRYWFPCYDTPNDKLLTEVYVKFNRAYQVLSNGVKLKEKENPDGTITWHYKMNHPHSTYLVMLGIGKYNIKSSKSKSGVPLYMWYYPEWKDRVDFTYMYSEKIFDFFEKEIGIPYAWESYSNIPVQDFMFGAMENTTATLFGDFFMSDAFGYNDRNYVAVNAHELAHQWFGDYVTARSGTAHWLQESFATHYNMMAENEIFGNDHFDWGRRHAHTAAIAVKDKKPISHTEANSTIIYQKGSQVLEMLKYITGREGFNKAIKKYLLDHKYANVDSDDLLNAFQDELGMSLEWFWDEWVYKGGEPNYKVIAENIIYENKRFTEFKVQQIQPISDISGLFKMPFLFEVHYKDGSVDSKKVILQKESENIKIENPFNKEIDYYLFDPNSRVMKSVSFNKPFEMLVSQALKAPFMLDRYDALLALRNFPVAQKINILEEIYSKNSFHAIKSEALSQIINDLNPESLKFQKLGIHDQNVQVRKAMITNVININKELLTDYELLLRDSSYQTISMALEKLCYQYPENCQKYLEKTKNYEGTNGRNVKIKWLEISALYSKSKSDYLDSLVKYTSNSYEFLTRTNAMAALRRLNFFNETLLANCVDAKLSSNSRLSGPAGETLQYFYHQGNYKKMICDFISNRECKAWEKELLAKIIQP